MKVLGYVNRFSRGVYRVQKELEENGNGKASFDFSLITAFRVVEPISTTYFEEGFGEESDNKSDNKLGESDNKSDNKLGESTNKTLIKSEEMPNKLPNKSEETPNKSEELPNKLEGLPNKSTNKTPNKKEESTNKSGETPNKFEELPNKSEGLPNKSGGTTQETTQERILVAIQAKPEVTQKELAQTIGITLDGIKYHIKNMTKLGIIKHEGSTKSGKWIIINN